MNDQQVTNALQELASREVPDGLNLWPAIRARLQPQRRSSRWSRPMPATRLGWALLALAGLLILGTGVYAVASIVDRLFDVEPGLQQIQAAGLGQTLNLSQTLDGVTVTVEQAYADANRVVLGLTIRSADGRRYEPGQMTLTGSNGVVLWPMSGLGVTGESELLKVNLPPGEGSYVFSFDASPVEGAPQTLDLHLALEVSEFLTPEAVEPTAEPPSVVAAKPAQRGTVVGPYSFDLSLPFIAGRKVEVDQAVEAAGVNLRLARVVVTPSETSALLCANDLAGEWHDWWAVAGLQTATAQAESNWGAPGQGACITEHFLPPLADNAGEWTLAVTELIRFDREEPGKQERLAGPWVFRFPVP